ncbi:MAG: oxygenase MpaB family protein, partial [Solirubrobacteraceae bacterium]
SWEIHGDLATLGIAGTATVLMELLHPAVMAGVHDHSSFWVDPERRARNTLGYVLRTTFGNSEAATRVIEGVKRIHARVGGTTPEGVAYRALDPELIAWVHTSIPWGVMRAYESYVRPLSTAEKDRYLREQAPIGRMGGADWVPETVAELDDYVERMRPKLVMNAQLVRFMDFIAGRSAELPTGRLDRVYRWTSICAAMALMPDWAQRLTGTERSESLRRFVLRPTDHWKGRLVRWVCPELPCKRIALARANAAATRAA